jgi:hypothetical protein
MSPDTARRPSTAWEWVVPSLAIQAPFAVFLALVTDWGVAGALAPAIVGLGLAGLASRVSVQAAVGASACVAFVLLLLGYAAAVGPLSID